ncbi:chemotaxis response regulator protein-glutamate methylesterase [Desulfohalobiaceae bacterium Ax17]|jgi:two-component system chemotaxis response regulator CheB|uniref:protein-glutamate methylesterase/protein-glutamine glutaminase n=1 Tax=Desulfovulcanus ferrireducens TaxID=2831190 RepID=UPI00207BA611|nr:chemotaxis response regulator protein-glutamate methylesterase [Desulfovulcanus ferrireducens]MBT8764484.1 chemotaxis response regulator protein-glutamate methylesterase [Desulfovulcanus ferrireducens]
MSKPIKVLVIDDSALVRQVLSEVLSSDPEIEVVATAQDPLIAAHKMRRQAPDVIILDVEMPRMDGLTFLKKIMSQHPIPVIICSTLTEQGAEVTLRAMEYGAVEIIQKPKLGTKKFLQEAKIILCDAVKAAAKVKPKKICPSSWVKVEEKKSADVILPLTKSKITYETTDRVVAVGASTGGTEAIQQFLQAMPLNCPGIVIVQHMPEKFTTAFAKRLDSICAITVKEAQDRDTVLRGHALIAPGNKHMLLKRSGAKFYVQIKDGPLVSRHRPSVDVLFRSAARYAGRNAIGVIMTGMGDDGAKGMLEMHEAGAYCIAQDKDSCVVFGMPQEAINLGGVDKVLPLVKIPQEVMRVISTH